jgi:putative flippase GtrA
MAAVDQKSIRVKPADAGPLEAGVQSAVAFLRRLMPELSYYTIVSVAALAVDLVVFNGLQLCSLRASLAGMAGYFTGLVLHYALSKRFVFEASAHKQDWRRFAEFCATGGVGALITWSIITIATEWLALPAMLGKVAAVGASFFVVFLLRRTIVFARAV